MPPPPTGSLITFVTRNLVSVGIWTCLGLNCTRPGPLPVTIIPHTVPSLSIPQSLVSSAVVTVGVWMFLDGYMALLYSASTDRLYWHLDSSLGEVGGHLSSTQHVTDVHQQAEEEDENVSAHMMFLRIDVQLAEEEHLLQCLGLL